MIRLVVTDCDGVLTSDRKTYTESGELHKQFSGRDTTVVRKLESLGVSVVVLSGDDRVNAKFCEMHRIPFVKSVYNKDIALMRIISDHAVEPEETLFIGDDLPDIAAGRWLKSVGGRFFCPVDAAMEVQTEATALAAAGGRGVLSVLYADYKVLFTGGSRK